MEAAVVMCNGEEITQEDLPPTISSSSSGENIAIPQGLTLDEAEKIIIQETLLANSNNKTRTAEILGIGRKTLQRKLAEWGIEGEEAP